ncbi:MAG: BT1926 family outer membrane beta-barrel protein [Prolixibacteraceae bacterium]
MKKLIIFLTVTISFGPLAAQKTVPGPEKGTVTVALMLGSAATYESGNWLMLPDPPVTGESSQTVYSPNLYNYPTRNSLINMIGAEGKWFFSDTWALRLNGAGLFSSSPAYEGTPGVAGSDPVSSIPTYNDVPAREDAELIMNVGVDKYYNTSNKNLFWYIAPVANFHYARKTGFEVTATNPATDPGTTRYAEGWGIGLSGIAGIEYFANSGLVFGFEIRGASYTYTMNNMLPQDGLKNLKADNHNIGFLSQPMVKIGFKF